MARKPAIILELRDTHEIGGPGKTILETHRAIDPARFETHLAVFQRRGEATDTPFIRAAGDAGLPVHIIRGIHQYDPRLITGLARLVQKLNADIVHAHEVKSDVVALAASKLRPVPIVTTLHGWIGNSPKQRAMIALDRFTVRRFDLVIAVSSLIRDQLHAAGVPPAAVRLLHNGIVLERYRRSEERGFLAKLVGQPLPGPIVVSIGRLSPEKGHADLLKALAQVATRLRRFSVVLVGDGPERPRLEEMIERLGLRGVVHLPGYVDRPDRVLNEADLAVLPSHTEGLPNAALEALAMEVPVLATRVGGTPEVVVDGETGRLVEAANPDALAGALLEFFDDPGRWQEMARRGRIVVQQAFDFSGRTKRLESIYGELLSQS